MISRTFTQSRLIDIQKFEYTTLIIHRVYAKFGIILPANTSDMSLTFPCRWAWAQISLRQHFLPSVTVYFKPFCKLIFASWQYDHQKSPSWTPRPCSRCLIKTALLYSAILFVYILGSHGYQGRSKEVRLDMLDQNLQKGTCYTVLMILVMVTRNYFCHLSSA